MLSTIYGLVGVFMAGLGYKLWRGSQMPHALAIAKAKAFVCLSIDLGQSNKPSMQRLLTARRDR